MRKFTFLAVMFCLLGLGNIAYTQIVNIPDANFKAVLLNNPDINTNGDGEIQTYEAVAYTDTLDVIYSAIFDITGIEAFSALTYLICSGNHITSLDVSANTSLTYLNCFNNFLTSLDVSANNVLTFLECGSNQLTSLNVSANTALTDLGCYNNQLTSIDVSANTALTVLGCGENQLISLNVATNGALTALDCRSNQLTSLDVSANTALVALACNDNSLTSLDVSANTALYHLYCSSNQLTNLNIKNGNNINFTFFNVTNNPNLTCIQVDDDVFMNSNWSGSKDATASYSEDCTVGISELINPTEIKTYPNPTTGKLSVSLSSGNIGTVEIYNLIGEKVYEKNFNQQKPALSKVEGSTEIDISNSPCGIYFLKVIDGNMVYTSKIVVQ